MTRTLALALLIGATTVAGCSTLTRTEPAMPSKGIETANPLLAPWSGAFDGVPPFDRASVALIGTALETAMAMELAEVEAVAASPEPPTFENVRRITKVGSPNTIYTHIRSYQKVLPERILARQGPQVPDLPDDIAGHLVDIADDADLVRRLHNPTYRARPERAVVIAIEAFDWNCPQHIPQRFTLDELEPALAPLREELARLRAENTRLESLLAARV